jgi:hypothetical protein
MSRILGSDRSIKEILPSGCPLRGSSLFYGSHGSLAELREVPEFELAVKELRESGPD